MSLKGLGAKTDWRKITSRKVTLTLSQLRVAVVRSEKLVAEVGDTSGNHRKENVCC
jgi:hypothetical protein